MMESLFKRTQIRCLFYTVNNYSDSEYELLLLIQILPSYKLNPTNIAFASQHGMGSEVIGVTR
jgi:hypothetical protein